MMLNTGEGDRLSHKMKYDESTSYSERVKRKFVHLDRLKSKFITYRMWERHI